MALLLGKCHAVTFGGSLINSNTIEVKLPFEDINTNLWQISINEISIDFRSEINILSGLSCNFVTDITFNNVRQIINHHPILNQVLLKGVKNEKKIVQLNKSWFYVTNPQETLQFTFNLFNEGKILKELINLDCFVYISVLIQRVK